MTDTTALALAAAVAAVPLAVWAARLAPGRRARTRADRDLFRLTRAQCSNPAPGPPCSTTSHRAEGTTQ